MGPEECPSVPENSHHRRLSGPSRGLRDRSRRLACVLMGREIVIQLPNWAAGTGRNVGGDPHPPKRQTAGGEGGGKSGNGHDGGGHDLPKFCWPSN